MLYLFFFLIYIHAFIAVERKEKKEKKETIKSLLFVFACG
jgi:hypothetical protein